MFAKRQMNLASTKIEKSIEKLSSGVRINRSGDDATNLAVSEKMRTQIRGLKQAERNALNGMSFIQVAESGIEQVNEILQRVRELSVQSANGIYSENDRISIQVEVSQLIDEVNRISTTVTFNRLNLLTGDFSRNSTKSMFFHVGANQNQRIKAYIATMNAKAFGLEEADKNKKSVLSVGEANEMIGIVDVAIDKLNMQRASLGAYYNRMETAVKAINSNYENLVAADSRIRDTDIAEEFTKLTKNQVLLQSGTAMLAQANMSSKLVVELLSSL